MSDSFDLERFVEAQSPVLASVHAELRRGSKRGHWMWFVFPQLKGLGSSATAHHFGISSRAEAEAYLRHPILGPRLLECVRIVNALEGRSAEQVFGGIDAMKFRSSMTLFAQADSEEKLFAEALQKYFHGEPDQRTLQLLAST